MTKNRIIKYIPPTQEDLENALVDFMADTPMAWLLFRIYFRDTVITPANPRKCHKSIIYLALKSIEKNPDLRIVRREFEAYLRKGLET